jgi:hypothetical protein
VFHALLLLFLGDPLLQQCFIPAVEEPFAKQLQTQAITFVRTERGRALFQSGFVDTKDFPTDQTLAEQRANFWRLQPRISYFMQTFALVSELLRAC